jgi:hypothetical protein
MQTIDGHKNAILGPALVWIDKKRVEVLVYDAEIVRQNLMDNDGMTSEEARLFIEFSIEKAYVGEDTPILVWTQDEWFNL